MNGVGSYSHGESCTLTAICNENYTFVNWTKDGVEVSADSCFTFIVTATEEYVAHFQFVDNVEEKSIMSELFPNPFTSLVSIKADKPIKTVSVYDIYGHLVKVQNDSGLETKIDLSELNVGTYLLQLDYGDSQSVQRIVKMK